MAAHLCRGGWFGDRLEKFDIWRVVLNIAVELQASNVRLTSIDMRHFGLRLCSHDVVHVVMASRTGATLVTLDRPLAAAARALGVMVEQPGA